MSSSEAAAHITANATFTIGLIAALSAMFFSFVLPKVFDYVTNRHSNTLKELIEIRKSLTDKHEDAAKFDKIIEYRRKRYLHRQMDLLEEIKNADNRETLEVWKTKKKSRLSHEEIIAWNFFKLGLITVASVVLSGVWLGQKFWPLS